MPPKLVKLSSHYLCYPLCTIINICIDQGVFPDSMKHAEIVPILDAAISDSFDTSNGVKQGGVLSPLLFNVYLDELILLLREQGVGCHMNGMFVGAFCYADDVTLLAPTGMALNAMLDTRFADAHDLSFFYFFLFFYYIH